MKAPYWRNLQRKFEMGIISVPWFTKQIPVRVLVFVVALLVVFAGTPCTVQSDASDAMADFILCLDCPKLISQVLAPLQRFRGVQWNWPLWRRNRHYLANGADISESLCRNFQQQFHKGKKAPELSKWIHVLYAAAYDSMHNAARRNYRDYNAAVQQYDYAMKRICEICPRCCPNIPNMPAQWPSQRPSTYRSSGQWGVPLQEPDTRPRQPSPDF